MCDNMPPSVEIPPRPPWLKRKPTRTTDAAETAALKFNVDPAQVLALMPEALHVLRQGLDGFDRARKRARLLCGLNSQIIARRENAYRDHSTHPGFDESSRTLAREFPELGIDPDSHDAPARVWEFLRIGAQPMPVRHSPEVAELAASWCEQLEWEDFPDDADGFDPAEWEPTQICVPSTDPVYVAETCVNTLSAVDSVCPACDAPTTAYVAELLLARALPWCEYGENYNRNIAASANRLRDVIATGHSGQMIQWAADELALRLDVHANPPSVEITETPAYVAGSPDQTMDDSSVVYPVCDVQPEDGNNPNGQPQLLPNRSLSPRRTTLRCRLHGRSYHRRRWALLPVAMVTIHTCDAQPTPFRGNHLIAKEPHHDHESSGNHLHLSPQRRGLARRDAGRGATTGPHPGSVTLPTVRSDRVSGHLVRPDVAGCDPCHREAAGRASPRVRRAKLLNPAYAVGSGLPAFIRSRDGPVIRHPISVV